MTELQPGMRVRMIHNPLRVGRLTPAEPRLRKDRRLYQVEFSNKLEYIYEDQLESVVEM